ncbi:hypothetical protein [Natrononativus amylolyticus]|uniref:hypothetical protein n=1 Tax=Natrononativus amylolyticus TaxID=2963434 RepID=UPI0020CCB4E1|nr:hypothetical protein [Natrononativus amylolyticus]
MSTESEHVTTFGIRSRVGWPIGGAVAGAVGAVGFGIVMWLFDPEIVAAAIPAIYGLEPTGVVGWGIHVAHGAVLGVVFAFLVTRELVLGVLQADVETEAISRTNVMLRIVGAGFAFGLLIWAVLPVLVLPVWTAALGTAAAGEFPTIAVESMVGHLVFGTVMGAVFAVTIDLTDRPTDDTLEE